MIIHNLHNALTGGGSISADDPKLKSAAHEFEASLMQEFLKPLQEDPLFATDTGDDFGPGGGSGSQSSSGALTSFSSEELAKAISERGGFGIATKILDHFRTVEKTAWAANQTKL